MEKNLDENIRVKMSLENRDLIKKLMQIKLATVILSFQKCNLISTQG